jgi:hypothetical protein
MSDTANMLKVASFSLTTHFSRLTETPSSSGEGVVVGIAVDVAVVAAVAAAAVVYSWSMDHDLPQWLLLLLNE